MRFNINSLAESVVDTMNKQLKKNLQLRVTYGILTPENMTLLQYPRCMTQHKNVSNFDALELRYGDSVVLRRFPRYLLNMKCNGVVSIIHYDYSLLDISIISHHNNIAYLRR